MNKKILEKREFLMEGFLITDLLSTSFIERKAIYEFMKESAKMVKKDSIVLDFGCGEKPYRCLFDVKEYIGLDIEKSGHKNSDKKADVYYDGLHIPFEDETVDTIISNQVFEHIFQIEEILKELYRVLKLGGELVVTVPFCVGEHEQPYDFFRYTSYGIMQLLQNVGFTIVKLEKLCNYKNCLNMLKIGYYAEKFKKRRSIVNGLCLAVSCIINNILGMNRKKVTAQDSNLFSACAIIAIK